MLKSSDQLMTDVENAGTEWFVERIINQVEMLLGPLSTETCVVAGNDDKSILRYNVYRILQDHREYLTI